jgi:hypothetical protein
MKNLYRRRKSPFRKFLEVAVMLVIVGGLGLVGYAAGRPLISFLRGERDTDGTDLPTVILPVDGNDSEETPADEPDEPHLTTPRDMNLAAIFAPSSVLDNSTSLAAYIQQAKNNGYNAVVLEMKDTTGNLLYAGTYERLNDDIIRGTLTAEQIIAVFEGTEVMPIARINTVLDQLAPRFIDDVSYFFADMSTRWADGRIEEGGKLWANPFLQGTRDYIAFLVGELADAGFEEIILANTLFPHFRPYDVSILEPEFTNRSTRFEGLAGLINAAAQNSGSARIIVEMSLKDVVESFAGFGGTAEVLRGRRDLDEGLNLLLIYNKDDFGAEMMTGESSSVILPGTMPALINMLFRQAEIQISDLEIIPAFSNSGLTETETADILGAFAELGFESFMIR